MTAIVIAILRHSCSVAPVICLAALAVPAAGQQPGVSRPAARPAAPPAATPAGAPTTRPLRTTTSLSYIAIDVPEPRPIQVQDLVTILVNEQAEVTANSQFNRQRRQSLQAEIAEFVRIVNGSLVNTAETSPAVDVSYNGRIQNNGIIVDREGIRYRITATVVAVLPNGNVVLEARKEVGLSDDLWEYTLSGTIAPDKINRDMTAQAEHVANLKVNRYQKGRVFDSTKRSWGLRLFDKFSPF